MKLRALIEPLRLDRILRHLTSKGFPYGKCLFHRRRKPVCRIRLKLCLRFGMHRFLTMIKLPVRTIISREWSLHQTCPYHVNWYGIFTEDRVVKRFGCHLMGFDQFTIHGANLQSTQHVGSLIKGYVASLDGSSYLRDCIATFMPHVADKKFNCLLSAHGPQMKTKGEDNPGTSMRSPEKHTDSIFGRVIKFEIPEKHFPVKRPALYQERGSKQSTMCLIALSHVELQMMTRNQFMMNRCF